jgi:hypothetical protein
MRLLGWRRGVVAIWMEVEWNEHYRAGPRRRWVDLGYI